jgi:hypothetical protein
MRNVFDPASGTSLPMWSAVAFALWLAFRRALRPARTRWVEPIAAAASWLLARLVVPYAYIALHWMRTVRW